MVGIILCIIAIYLYIYGKKRWSLLLFFMFMTNGFRIFTPEVLGVKGLDMAFVYTIVICIYSFFRERQTLNEDKTIRLIVGCLLLFLLCSTLFSFFYYKFTPFQILQGGRHLFLFVCYYFLRKTHRNDLYWVINVLYYVTIIHAGLYIIQVLTQLPVLPYGEAVVDRLTGVARYYNYPVFLDFFLFLLCLFPEFVQSRFKIVVVALLFAALFCTQGRTHITMILAFLFIGLLVKGQGTKMVKAGLIVCICFLPFSDMLVSRFSGESGANENEWETVVSGDFINYAHAGKMPEGTMAYRLAWVAERVIYLNDRPLAEKVFGLGMISDSQDIVHRKYDFNLGLLNQESDEIVQLGTPDIAYGSLITQFGYVGGGMVLWLWLYMTVFLYKNRRIHPFIFVGSIFIVEMIFEGFSGDTIGNMGNLVLPFAIISLAYSLKSEAVRVIKIEQR